MKNFTRIMFLLGTFLSVNKAIAGNGSPAETFRTNLYLLNNDNSVSLADGDLVQFNNAYSAAVDFYDAVKLQNINETLGLLRNNYLLSIERRPVITIADTLFLNLTKSTQRKYQFQLTAASLNHPGLTGQLQDKYTGINTNLDLNGTTTVNFTIDANAASQDANRFMVVFGPLSTTPVTFSSVMALQQNSNIAVNWNVSNEINIKEYQVQRSEDGNNFSSVAFIKVSDRSTATSNSYNWLDANAATGNHFYRIQSIGANGSELFSQVVKVKIEAKASSVSIFPNPVSNGKIGLQFTNQPGGIYKVRLISVFGQEIAARSVLHNGGSAAQNISFDKSINKGIYQLEIVKPDNTRTVTNIMFQ